MTHSSNLRAAFALGFGAIAALALSTPAAAQTITEYADGPGRRAVVR
jgi:hypothetical protein